MEHLRGTINVTRPEAAAQERVERARVRVQLLALQHVLEKRGCSLYIAGTGVALQQARERHNIGVDVAAADHLLVNLCRVLQLVAFDERKQDDVVRHRRRPQPLLV